MKHPPTHCHKKKPQQSAQKTKRQSIVVSAKITSRLYNAPTMQTSELKSSLKTNHGTTVVFREKASSCIIPGFYVSV